MDFATAAAAAAAAQAEAKRVAALPPAPPKPAEGWVPAVGDSVIITKTGSIGRVTAAAGSLITGRAFHWSTCWLNLSRFCPCNHPSFTDGIPHKLLMMSRK
jgi:hypothetical protein